MAWTTPATVNPGDIGTASWMNTYLRDNMNYVLGGRPIATKYQATSYSTTSNTFVDIDAANVINTVILSGSRAMCIVTMELSATNIASNYASIDVIVDSTTRSANGNTTTGLIHVGQNTNAFVTVMAYFTGLSAGSHTFKVQWKAGIATGGANNSTGGTGFVPFVSLSTWEF